jgi:superfamily I DNA and RNA helicase
MRGLSGSGKSTVLALKAAYIHACHPGWKIGVTFNTLSAKRDYLNAIDFFYHIQTGLITNWDNLTVCQAWGAESDQVEEDGMYHLFTSINLIAFFEYSAAKTELGTFDPFGEACERALMDVYNFSKEVFDIILIDEAQDFAAHFMRMCHTMLRSPKRLVFAYDELQNFRTQPMQPPETYFSNGDNGMPVLSVYQDIGCAQVDRILLGGCYEKPPAILSAAHALAFGIYRKPPLGEVSLIQMFENIGIWSALGYESLDGDLDYGKHVVIGRRPEEGNTLPDIDDQIVFKSFKSQETLDTWLIEEIKRNLGEDELRAQDIMIVVPAVNLFFSCTSTLRRRLMKEKIKFHMVGEDTPQSGFWKGESIAICNLYQVRSHEAAMVYVIDANTSWYSNYDMALIRNQLYSAMTRSNAWVRVVGIGRDMEWLAEEYERAKSQDFKFDFVYPTKQQLSSLRMAFRDNREVPIVSDPYFLHKMVSNALDLIRTGKVKLNDDQDRLLKDWYNNSGEIRYVPLIDPEDEDEDENEDEYENEDDGEGEFEDKNEDKDKEGQQK